jgi:hypothetical protein
MDNDDDKQINEISLDGNDVEQLAKSMATDRQKFEADITKQIDSLKADTDALDKKEKETDDDLADVINKGVKDLSNGASDLQ